mgnify:CR=1 FL=1
MDRTSLPLRITTSVVIVFSILFLPWWVAFALGIGSLLYFRNFWEIIPLFILVDALYGYGGARVFGIPYIHTVTGIVAYSVHSLVRTYSFL